MGPLPDKASRPVAAHPQQNIRWDRLQLQAPDQLMGGTSQCRDLIALFRQQQQMNHHSPDRDQLLKPVFPVATGAGESGGVCLKSVRCCQQTRHESRGRSPEVEANQRPSQSDTGIGALAAVQQINTEQSLEKRPLIRRILGAQTPLKQQPFNNVAPQALR